MATTGGFFSVDAPPAPEDDDDAAEEQKRLVNRARLALHVDRDVSDVQKRANQFQAKLKKAINESEPGTVKWNKTASGSGSFLSTFINKRQSKPAAGVGEVLSGTGSGYTSTAEKNVPSGQTDASLGLDALHLSPNPQTNLLEKHQPSDTPPHAGSKDTRLPATDDVVDRKRQEQDQDDLLNRLEQLIAQTTQASYAAFEDSEQEERVNAEMMGMMKPSLAEKLRSSNESAQQRQVAANPANKTQEFSTGATGSTFFPKQTKVPLAPTDGLDDDNHPLFGSQKKKIQEAMNSTANTVEARNRVEDRQNKMKALREKVLKQAKQKPTTGSTRPPPANSSFTSSNIGGQFAAAEVPGSGVGSSQLQSEKQAIEQLLRSKTYLSKAERQTFFRKQMLLLHPDKRVLEEDKNSTALFQHLMEQQKWFLGLE
ncbi:unnamed protein product [Amoebophrya sp. A120]|nr:unnamed protein product [Amoebophrya sp. A120]|eukprot:GSA120T00012110001.1